MKYTAEQIKPKKYPDEKPSKDDWYLAYPCSKGGWFFYAYETMAGSVYPWDTRPITWFIDIPDAPPELKPLPIRRISLSRMDYI